MEESTNAVSLAITVIITIGIVTVSIFFVRWGSTEFKKGTQTISSYKGMIENSAYALYDGTEVNGEELLEGYKELHAKVLQDGLTTFRFEFYTLALNGGFSDTPGRKKTDLNYLNPDARFRCDLIYSSEHQNSMGEWVPDSDTVVGLRAYQMREEY